MLTWSSSNANTCTAAGGWSGTRATGGTETITGITSTTSYSIQCGNGVTSASASTSVTATPAQSAPATLSFSGSPNLVQRGGQTTLTWLATGVETCFGSWQHNVPLAIAGTATLTIDGPTTQNNLELRCYGPTESIAKTVSIAIQTFSGELLIPSGNAVDSDVNDPDADYRSNDTIDSAMGLADFGSTPGYVNQPLAGPLGRSYENGDLVDYYRTSTMKAGQVIRLVMPTVDMNVPAEVRDDADLYLRDSDGRLIDAVISSGPSEVLLVPRDDVYVIEVRSVRGGMNYLLSLEDATPLAATSAERLSADFVPGEAIATVRGASAAGPVTKTRGAVASITVARKAGAPDREMRVAFDATSIARLKQQNATTQFSSRSTAGPESVSRAKLATLLALKALRQRSDVRTAELNRIVRGQATPGDPLYARQQWHYAAASLPLAWDASTGSSNVIVAIVDSGMVRDHPDLRDKFVDGYDFVSDPRNSDGDGLDDDYSDAGYQFGDQWIFHGTHVAGTVGASANNGVGGTGVAWGARLMPLRVLDGRGGTEYDMLQSVRYAAGLPNDSGRLPTRRADVINLSLSAPTECPALAAEVFEQVVAAGVVVVAAAGNFSGNVPSSPASCPGVISVGATGADGALAPYSNFGKAVSLVAPGGSMNYDLDQDGFPDGIFSASGTWQNGGVVAGYDWLEGTSMAAPHVAGVIALMRSIKPSLSPLEISQMLESGLLTDVPDPSSGDDLGRGRLNAVFALQAASGVFPSAPHLRATPSALNFGGVTESLTFQLRNSGSGLLSVQDVKSTVPWATVLPLRVDSQGLGDYQVLVTRAGSPRGIRNGTLDISSSAGPLVLPFVMTNQIGGPASWLGAVHVKARDAATGQVVRSLLFKHTLDRTYYRFDDLPAGRVILTAGTDMNNDGNVCDPGEVCGAFPSRRLPDVIDYNGVQTAVDLALGLTALTPTSASLATASRQ